MMNRHEISEADLNTAMCEYDYDPDMHNYPDEPYDYEEDPYDDPYSCEYECGDDWED
jgi:hypothetical protein